MTMTQEELIRQEVERQLQGNKQDESDLLKANLYSLGGAALGAAGGYAAMNPIDAFLENRAVKKLSAATQQREALEVLSRIHTGSLTWDDIPDRATREALQEAYAMNKDLLDNPQALQQAMGNEQKVYRFGDLAEGNESVQKHIKKTNRNRFLPDLDGIRNPKKLSHPAISIGSLVGMTGGYYLADQLAKKKHSENV